MDSGICFSGYNGQHLSSSAGCNHSIDVGKMSRRAVSKSAEIFRVRDLPRRDWESEDIQELTDKLTKYLKTPDGNMKLRQIQAVALKECFENGGLFGPIPVGYGKSLISFLAPTLNEAKRPLLLVPAKLKTKTEREMHAYAMHFKIPDMFKIMSYELLSRERGQRELIEYGPDMIIADECHRLKNTKAACTKRIGRWIKEHKDTIFLGVSGTITRKSIMDYAHILRWALKEHAPIPMGWRETKEWSLALDENLPFEWERYQPGALMLFGSRDEQQRYASLPNERLRIARETYAARLTQTPGVVSVQGEALGTSLLLETKIVKPGPAIREHFEKLRTTWQTPDGLDIMEAPVFWMYTRQYACGFYYKWRNKAPQPWLDARKNWARFVSKAIASNRRGLDTEFQIAQAVVRGEYEATEYETWRDLRKTFTPDVEAIWVDDAILQYAKKWAEDNEGIIWTEHIAFGERLSELSGLHYYGAGGVNKEGSPIEDAQGPIIASIQSNGEGRNLQRWNRNLIVSCPPSAATFEQLVGRTHRHGQDAEEVTVEIMIKSIEDWEGFLNCKKQAHYVHNTTQQQQKILMADVNEIEPLRIEQLIKSKDPLWKK